MLEPIMDARTRYYAEMLSEISTPPRTHDGTEDLTAQLIRGYVPLSEMAMPHRLDHAHRDAEHIQRSSIHMNRCPRAYRIRFWQQEAEAEKTPRACKINKNY